MSQAAPARTFVIGDIHGHADRLAHLLERLRPESRPGDGLVFVGDYVDRGPDTRRVVDLVLAERECWPGPVVTLKGNHEGMMLDALSEWREHGRTDWDWLGAMQGAATVASYTRRQGMEAFDAALPPEHRRFFENLALWHEDEHGIYVHAGVAPGRHPRDCPEEILLWIREPFIDSHYAWPKPVVFGHTPQHDDPTGPWRQLRWRPLNRPEKIGLDTGCAYGGPLTAVILPERRFIDSNAPPF